MAKDFAQNILTGCVGSELRLVCINDLSLVAEYSLGELPALVYYRHTIPILYQGQNKN